MNCKNRTLIFAAYLPQFHEIKENNEFWGVGFTDWVGVKKAVPQFQDHNQPRIPLNENYYDLSDAQSIAWQASLAKKYGIDGFCIYHYWFEKDKTVLETPAQLILTNPDIDISFFFSWDNTSWIRSWSNINGNAWAPQFDNNTSTKENKYLLKHEYGNEESWKKHFMWLLPFFHDKRYYKIDGKPVFIMFRVDDKITMTKMYEYWNSMAISHGFPGIYMISGVGPFRNRHCLDAQFLYQPLSLWNKKKAIIQRLEKYLHINCLTKYKNIWNYEDAWKKIIQQSKRCIKKHIFVSGLVRYDDTPRRGNKANIIINETPQLFEKYFSILYKLNCKEKMEFMLLTAWNEWGEGAYLEPDEIDGYAYLDVVKKVSESYKV